MMTLWLVVAVLTLLHTTWTIAHAIVNKGLFSNAPVTPATVAPYVWGGVCLLAIGQGAYVLVMGI